ncbi:homeodomain-interacting protein kinase 2-like isoform X1 [Armigeres subalbatus]|uniref:homeodomain-interacting protein kinase 2-like isoform X1 n=1 Tax=Armigeres subalbatus TaxID=124917 RepID=UPI002ED44507
MAQTVAAAAGKQIKDPVCQRGVRQGVHRQANQPVQVLRLCVVRQCGLGTVRHPGDVGFQIRTKRLKVYFADAGSPPTKHMPNSASKTLFYRDVDSTYPFWRLNRRMSARRKPKTNAKRLETDIEGCQFLAEKTDRRELIDLLKRLLTIDHERNRPLAHLVDSSFYNNVKAPNDGGVP